MPALRSSGHYNERSGCVFVEHLYNANEPSNWYLLYGGEGRICAKLSIDEKNLNGGRFRCFTQHMHRHRYQVDLSKHEFSDVLNAIDQHVTDGWSFWLHNPESVDFSFYNENDRVIIGLLF